MNSATLAEKAEQCGAEVGRYEGTMVWVKFHSPSSLEAFAAAIQRTEQQANPWRQAVDDALIAHALDCTGPGDDPKEKVKELIEWAVTIATDPRVSEQAALALQPSASAEPVQEPTITVETRLNRKFSPPPVTAAREQEASATGAEPLTDQQAMDMILKHACVGTTVQAEEPVDAARVRDEALEEAADRCAAQSKRWKDERSIYVATECAAAIRSLIGTTKSEGEA